MLLDHIIEVMISQSYKCDYLCCLLS